MSDRDQVERNAWDRWPVVFMGMAFLFQGISLTIYLAGESRSAGQVRSILGLAAAFSIWYLYTILSSGGRFERSLLLSLGLLTAGFVLWGGQMVVDPVFVMMAGAFYPTVFFNLPFRPALILTFILTGLLVLGSLLGIGSPLGTFPTLTFVVAFFPAIVLALFINAIITQSNERKNLIDELQAARDDLAAAERQAGMLAERQRLAGEIHDTLAQSFSSIVMQLEAAEAAIEKGPHDLRAHIDQARDIARQSLEQARRLVAALRPDLLERAPLHEALERLTERWSQETGIEVRTVSTGKPAALHPDGEVTVFRAVQEALNNIRKHAAATEVMVTLSYMADEVALDIYDNGRGFDGASLPAPDEAGGFGLPAMRERVEGLGGTFTVESAPGSGTTLALILPVYVDEMELKA